VLNDPKKISSKMKYVYKKAEFDANFESVEKAKKISCAKKLSMKK
jgi:hypothetical protein